MTVPRIMLIGDGGQVGFELARLLSGRGELTALDYPALDLSSPDSIAAALAGHRPDLVINAAAYTAVDKAEEEPDLAMAINGTAPGILAAELKKSGGALVHYSTEYVFDGRSEIPCTEADAPNPLSAYGRSKLAGEEAIRASGVPHLLIRSSWIYGSRGHNFLRTILRLAREQEELRVVDDQIGAPTWCRDLGLATVEALSQCGAFETPAALSDRGGLFHLTASGFTSWFGFAEEILRLDPNPEEQRVKELIPIPTSDYPTPAQRPRNSRLDCSSFAEAFGIELPPWHKSLAETMRGSGVDC
jgi:dTDP-4-dehydrorhamnose reductase